MELWIWKRGQWWIISKILYMHIVWNISRGFFYLKWIHYIFYIIFVIIFEYSLFGFKILNPLPFSLLRLISSPTLGFLTTRMDLTRFCGCNVGFVQKWYLFLSFYSCGLSYIPKTEGQLTRHRPGHYWSRKLLVGLKILYLKW